MDYCSVSTFHHLYRYDTQNLSFSTFKAAIHTWQNTVSLFLASTWTVLNVRAFESFLMLSNVSKLLCDQILMIMQVQLTPDMSIHEAKFPDLCPRTFGGHQAFFIFNITIIIFEESKPISACCFWHSIGTVSFNIQHVCFSCIFLLNKVVQ